MDTPGHVDFAYEVSRSLAACEGALLVVDAAQGVEAQTLANVYQSIEHDHEIVPVINKIDLPAADPEGVRQEIEEIIGLDASRRGPRLAPRPASASTKCSRRSSTRSRRPRATPTAPLKAMLVDSWYDPYLGVVILVRVIDGALRKGQQVKFMAAGTTHLVDRVGCFRPKIEQLERARPRRDRLHHRADQGSRRDPRRRHHHRRQAARRRRRCPASSWSSRSSSAACSRSTPTTSRSSATASTSCASTTPRFSFEMETSAALGFGFRCGFLGLLHLEIIQERLTREYDLDLITTAPSRGLQDRTSRHSKNEAAQMIELHNPADLPDPNRIESIEEPWIEATIYVPDEYLGAILKLCQDRRGIQKDLTYVGTGSHARAHAHATSCRSTKWCSTSTTG